MRVLRLAHHAVVSPWRERERELRRLGVDLTLISAKRWNEGGVAVELSADGDDFVRAARTVGRHPSVFLFNPVVIWRALGENPELIDLHEEPNSLATAEVLFLRWLKRSRAPYVLYSAQNLDKRYPIPFRWFESRALRGAAAVYVCNREAAAVLRGKGLVAPTEYIPLGVDLAFFAPASRESPASPLVIGYVGRLERHKGVDVLLRAVANRQDWSLQLTGDGSQRAALETLANELGISDRVAFRGHAGGSELAARYREVDVIAIPSLPWPGWLEQFCRVAIEAMASGVPVVASATGAIPDVVAGAGLLVEPGAPVALEAALATAAEPSEWARLRTVGLQRSRDFDWAQVASEQLSLYKTALGRSPEASELAEARSTDRPDPEVLIVAYGSPDLLDGCLSALGSGLPVTVVDNSSLARTRQIVESRGGRYVDSGANLGFARGVNLGLETIAKRGGVPADVLLLNPDARIDTASVRAMHDQLRRSPKVAAMGATQTEPESGHEVRVWWPFPSPIGACIEAIGLGGLRRQHGFAIGSILFLRREALDQLGPLDEQFFLYAEETDWQFRARRLGWQIAVADVIATHEGGGTGGDPTAREAHFFGSTERYLRKHYGAGGWQVYRLATLVGAAVRGVVLRGERGRTARRRRDIFARGPVATESSWQ